MRVRNFFTVTLRQGDVLALNVIQTTGQLRLVLHDEDSGAPVIQALLSDTERDELITALLTSNGAVALEAKRPFRAPRPAAKHRSVPASRQPVPASPADLPSPSDNGSGSPDSPLPT